MELDPLCHRLKRLPLIAALGLLMLGGCQQAQEATVEAAPLTPVDTMAVVFQPSFQLQHRLVGQINNQQTSNIGFELAGTIATIAAAEGDRISAGATLASLDTDLLLSERQRLQANIEQLQAQQQLNDSTLTRQLQLQQQGYQSQQQLDELTSQRRSLAAQLQQAQSALQSNQLQLNKSTLKAPFSGTIAKRQLAPGQVVTPGQTLFTLIPDQGAEAKVGLPVSLLSKLDGQFDYQLRHQDQLLDAQLLGRSAAVDATTRTVDLRFALPQQQPWFDGDLIYLQLTETVTTPVVSVPIDALTSGIRGRWNVMVAISAGDHWQLQRRDVAILHSKEDRVLLQGALAEGELLVYQGVQRLVAGQRVEINKAAL